MFIHFMNSATGQVACESVLDSEWSLYVDEVTCPYCLLHIKMSGLN